MNTRTIAASRWVLLPVALLAGVILGLWIAAVYARGIANRNWANQAVIFANTAAQIDAGDGAAAQKAARQHMTIAVESLARSVDPPEAKRYANALRNVSTYLSVSPGVMLSPKAQTLLAAFPPMSGGELDSSACESGICTLARQAKNK